MKGILCTFYCFLQNNWLPATPVGSPWTKLTISLYLWSISNVPALYYISVIMQAILLYKEQSQSIMKHCSINAAFCYTICCWEEIQENITKLVVLQKNIKIQGKNFITEQNRHARGWVLCWWKSAQRNWAIENHSHCVLMWATNMRHVDEPLGNMRLLGTTLLLLVLSSVPFWCGSGGSNACKVTMVSLFQLWEKIAISNRK